MRSLVRAAAAFAAFSAAAALAVPATAAPKRPLRPLQQPVQVARSAAGTVIQPTTTILPDGRGHVRVVIHPRSYLDTGTEVSVGDRSYHDYVELPAGDPGHQQWFFGPDVQGRGSYPLPGPFSGINSNSPF